MAVGTSWMYCALSISFLIQANWYSSTEGSTDVGLEAPLSRTPTVSLGHDKAISCVVARLVDMNGSVLPKSKMREPSGGNKETSK